MHILIALPQIQLLTLTNLSTPPETSRFIDLEPGCISTLYIGSRSCQEISGVTTFILKVPEKRHTNFS